MSTSKDDRRRIELLTEENFGSWFVNIRAELRSKKLWKYTQQVYESEDSTATTETGEPTKKEQKAIKDWEEKSQEAADLMTPTISPGVQQKLTETEFNDGYLMLIKLQLDLQPTGSSEFMRLSKEYYTLQFKAFRTVPEYLTQIKVLEEKIDATKVVLDTNNRTILCLSMSLPQEYQYLVQIWAVTPAITAEKARQMVLEVSRQHNQVSNNSRNPAAATSMLAQQDKKSCPHCGSTTHSKEKCYLGNPKTAPEWFKLKMKEQAKGQGRKAEQAQKFQAKIATYGGNYVEDFQDGLHISV